MAGFCPEFCGLADIDLALIAHDLGEQIARAFTAPARAVERLRIEAASNALEAGSTVQTVAKTSGFPNPETMRRAFMRVRGVRPSGVRRG